MPTIRDADDRRSARRRPAIRVDRQARRHARPHPVARSRRRQGARPARHRASSGRRCENGDVDPERAALGAAGRARRSCRSRTSASRSRTARRTRWSSSRASTTRAPVAGAKVSIVSRDNSIALDAAPPAPTASRSARRRRRALRDPRDDSVAEFDFVVTAEKDGDVAYVGSDWNEGIEPWEFGTDVQSARGASRCCAARCSRDRGVYRLGEEVHFKAILRRTRRAACGCCRDGTPVLHHACATARTASSTSAPSRVNAGAAPSGR